MPPSGTTDVDYLLRPLFFSVEQGRNNPGQKNRSGNKIEEVLNKGPDWIIKHYRPKTKELAKQEQKEWRRYHNRSKEGAKAASTKHRESC